MMKKIAILSLLGLYSIHAMHNDFKQGVLIFAASTAASATFGALHAKAVAKVSPDYAEFEMKRSFPLAAALEAPSIWGIQTSWFVGAGFGLFAAIAARAGSGSKLQAHEVAIPLALAMTGTALGSYIGYVTGKVVPSYEKKYFIDFMNRRHGGGMPKEEERQSQICLAGHMVGGAYNAGCVAGVSTIAWILAHRALKAYG